MPRAKRAEACRRVGIRVPRHRYAPFSLDPKQRNVLHTLVMLNRFSKTSFGNYRVLFGVCDGVSGGRIIPLIDCPYS
jgi:hypothetical protein